MKSIFPKMVIAFFLAATLPHIQLIIISLQVARDVIHNKTMSPRGTRARGYAFKQACGPVSGLKKPLFHIHHSSDTSGPPLFRQPHQSTHLHFFQKRGILLLHYVQRKRGRLFGSGRPRHGSAWSIQVEGRRFPPLKFQLCIPAWRLECEDGLDGYLNKIKQSGSGGGAE